MKVPVLEWINADHHLQSDQIKEKILALSKDFYQEKIKKVGNSLLSQFEKSVILQTLDHHWREHLASMDQLRQGIHLRGYAQKDPKQEYKKEAFTLFTMMLDGLKYDVIKVLFSVEVQSEEDAQAVEDQRRAEQIQQMSLHHENLMQEDAGKNQDHSYKRQEK